MKYKEQDIIMIVYHDNIPHSVITEYDTYDFDIHAGNWIMFYHSGMGKNWEETNGLKIFDFDIHLAFPESEGHKVWLNHDYLYRLNHSKGILLIDNPIEIEGKKNPFEYAQEVSSIEYCEICKLYYASDGCNIHGIEDD